MKKAVIVIVILLIIAATVYWYMMKQKQNSQQLKTGIPGATGTDANATGTGEGLKKLSVYITKPDYGFIAIIPAITTTSGKTVCFKKSSDYLGSVLYTYYDAAKNEVALSLKERMEVSAKEKANKIS